MTVEPTGGKDFEIVWGVDKSERSSVAQKMSQHEYMVEQKRYMETQLREQQGRAIEAEVDALEFLE